MGLWNRIFGKEKDKNPIEGKAENIKEQVSQYNLKWVESDKNPWEVRLLDLRPISQTMLSTSKDPRMATNAISYNQEDGLVFLTQKTKSTKSFNSAIEFSIDSSLERGVLYIPADMEKKWAIYFHENKILFIRSWSREVFVIAETTQGDNKLVVNKIIGEFTENESNEFTEAVLKFIIHSHILKEMIPAPIPVGLKGNTDSAGLWAFSTYGNMAHFGYFESKIEYSSQATLRSHSLLHIAIARGEISKIKEEIENGTNINSIASDGMSTLQWAIAANTEVLEFLLKSGADPNAESDEGATPIMNAVQSNKIEHLRLLVSHNANVNKQDKRGFTALHRAAEMGFENIVKELIDFGADKRLNAEGHTPMSLAKAMKNSKIVAMLE